MGCLLSPLPRWLYSIRCFTLGNGIELNGNSPPANRRLLCSPSGLQHWYALGLVRCTRVDASSRGSVTSAGAAAVAATYGGAGLAVLTRIRERVLEGGTGRGR